MLIFCFGCKDTAVVHKIEYVQFTHCPDYGHDELMRLRFDTVIPSSKSYKNQFIEFNNFPNENDSILFFITVDLCQGKDTLNLYSMRGKQLILNTFKRDFYFCSFRVEISDLYRVHRKCNDLTEGELLQEVMYNGKIHYENNTKYDDGGIIIDGVKQKPVKELKFVFNNKVEETYAGDSCKPTIRQKFFK